MDTEKRHTGACKPEVGRGCAFCNCGSEPEAKLCDGCFKLHETAWLDEYPVNMPSDIVEVRFKNTRRSFYQNVNNLDLKRGDIVAVEASPGHDIGVVSLTGDLVARQMRRTGFNPYNGEYKKIYRKAKPYDIEKWQEAIALEHETMIASRQIAADMGLTGLLVGHDASGSGNDGNTKAAEYLRQLLCASVYTQARLGHTLDAGDSLLAVINVLQCDADNALGVALYNLERLDVAFIEQDLGNSLLHLGCGYIHTGMTSIASVADTSQHIRDRISDLHKMLSFNIRSLGVVQQSSAGGLIRF